MAREKRTPKERLVEDINWLPEEDWKKVRRYVTMLRALRRMDHKAFVGLVAEGVAEWKDERDYGKLDAECDFCGKRADQVKRLLAGHNGFICDECIELCCEVLKEEYEKEQKKE